MTHLRRMSTSAFPAYLDAAIVGYAEVNVAAGRWPAEGALQRSREDFEHLLPLGMETPDNFLLDIIAEEGGIAVGVLWYALHRQFGTCSAFVYDIEIKPEYRRRGHAWRALQQLEEIAREAGATSLGLNVFANNSAAQALYSKLGYRPTNMNMRKILG